MRVRACMYVCEAHTHTSPRTPLECPILAQLLLDEDREINVWLFVHVCVLVALQVVF